MHYHTFPLFFRDLYPLEISHTRFFQPLHVSYFVERQCDSLGGNVHSTKRCYLERGRTEPIIHDITFVMRVVQYISIVTHTY